jgi:hypothetical protein
VRARPLWRTSAPADGHWRPLARWVPMAPSWPTRVIPSPRSRPGRQLQRTGGRLSVGTDNGGGRSIRCHCQPTTGQSRLIWSAFVSIGFALTTSQRFAPMQPGAFIVTSVALVYSVRRRHGADSGGVPLSSHTAFPHAVSATATTSVPVFLPGRTIASALVRDACHPSYHSYGSSGGGPGQCVGGDC